MILATLGKCPVPAVGCGWPTFIFFSNLKTEMKEDEEEQDMLGLLLRKKKLLLTYSAALKIFKAIPVSSLQQDYTRQN